ncbi:pyocin knob domain-containing protein [Paenibacillus polymyxa]|uniref:pyocin knob domain-containing protein n=1 Tax=Paenibacillus polymyxa TaxID=1406 RepID=UPI0012DA0252|nr:pyocin knob domain-containing protein [Paenibacillus polymyxa]
MYPPVVNSPKTELTELITDKQTEIPVANPSVLLQGEGIAVLGNGDAAETITYTSVEESVLKGCVRGFEGVARAWPVGTRVARNFTAADFKAVQANIEELQGEVSAAAATATAALPASQKGAASGVATLGSDSKVPADQLPISTSTNSTSNSQVAAASAVKVAYDLANKGMLPRTTSATDFNSIVTLGVYTIGAPGNLLNAPPNVYGWGLLVVDASNQPYIVQTFISIGDRDRTFHRGRSEGETSWNPWKEVFTTSGGTIGGRIISTADIFAELKVSGQLSWSIHKSGSTSRVYFAPSNTVGGGDYNFEKGISFDSDNLWWSGGDLNSLKAAASNLYSGNGSPEGAVSAPVGSLYRRWDGSPGATLYSKESGGSGNTGWRAL